MSAEQRLSDLTLTFDNFLLLKHTAVKHRGFVVYRVHPAEGSWNSEAEAVFLLS